MILLGCYHLRINQFNKETCCITFLFRLQSTLLNNHKITAESRKTKPPLILMILQFLYLPTTNLAKQLLDYHGFHENWAFTISNDSTADKLCPKQFYDTAVDAFFLVAACISRGHNYVYSSCLKYISSQ